MTDRLQKASVWLEARRVAYATRSVTYRRGADSVSVGATIGRTTFEITSDEGARIETESRDFLISTATLILAGAETLPANGDTIEFDTRSLVGPQVH